MFLSSAVFLSSSGGDYASAEEGDITVQGGTVFQPLASFTPQLSANLQDFKSPVQIWEKFQNDADARKDFKIAGPSSLAALTPIDNVSGYPQTRTVGTTPLPETDSFSLHTNPDSQKIKHLEASNKASFYQVWHSPEESRQITLSGTISHTSKPDPIDIHIPTEGKYHSEWHGYHFHPTEAEVTSLRHYYYNDIGCISP